jgi:TonB family protein
VGQFRAADSKSARFGLSAAGKAFAVAVGAFMSQAVLSEVFTADEVARAAGVALADVRACLATGDIRPIPGTQYIAGADAVRLGRRVKAVAFAAAPREMFAVANRQRRIGRRPGLSAFAASAVHAALVAAAMWFSAGTARMEVGEVPPPAPTRLVFITTPGPGGGGGGGGVRIPLPAARARRRGSERRPVPAPQPVEAITPAPLPTARTPEPPPLVTAPVVPAAADPREQAGVVARAHDAAASQGPGVGGGAGTGQGTGSGEGFGSGLDSGTGGGTGGGPYRPGSGIEPPRLLREVKAIYTDDARRRGLTGEVLLEIVVRRDGSVGEVSVIRAPGGGLEQRAIDAVRRWRFAPARRQGVPVDVIVEVAVEFSLR